MRTIINSAWFAGAVLAPFAAAPAAAVERIHDDHVLGTSFDMVVAAGGLASMGAFQAARAEIDRLEPVMSGWRDDSELAALNRSSGPFRASPDLFAVIAACEAWRSACPGAFSARLGSVEALWREAQRTDVLPLPAALQEAAQRAEAARVRLDPATRTIDRDGVVFAVDAYAKGYIIDAALAEARRAAPGARGILIDIGGDVACDGTDAYGAPWRVGVAQGQAADNAAPDAAVVLTSGAAATSGPGARDRRIEGAAWSHLLSPETGHASPARLVSVMADKAADADALATALAAMPTERALAFAGGLKGVEARIVDGQGAVFTTGGWDRQALPVRPAPVLFQAQPKAGARAPFPAGYEVEIHYEIPLFGVRAKIPYVAIFITNEQGQLVRTLTHLGNRPARFLDSNYVWRRLFDAKGGDLATVIRPTRAPGKYTATWDGKDDAGETVGQGRYTVNIEFSREHGGHTVQTIPITVGPAAMSGSAAAQDEAGPASVTYGKSQ